MREAAGWQFEQVVAVKTHIWKGPKAFKISQIRPVRGGGMRRSYSSRDYDRAVLVVRRPEEYYDTRRLGTLGEEAGERTTGGVQQEEHRGPHRQGG